MILSAKTESAHKNKTKLLHSTQLSPEVQNNFLTVICNWLPDNKYFLLNFFTESN